jgi:hypothetical protein
VKIGVPAVLITAALAASVTACSSPHSGSGSSGAASGSGGTGTAATLYRNPTCRQFQRDLSAWKAAVSEPGDASTVLLNASTRSSWRKFGRQLRQLSQADIGGNNAAAARRTASELARTATLVSRQGTEPISQITSVQYQRTVTNLEHVTTDCTHLSG